MARGLVRRGGDAERPAFERRWRLRELLRRLLVPGAVVAIAVDGRAAGDDLIDDTELRGFVGNKNRSRSIASSITLMSCPVCST